MISVFLLTSFTIVLPDTVTVSKISTVAPGVLTIKFPLIVRFRSLIVPVALPLIVTLPVIVWAPVSGP